MKEKKEKSQKPQKSQKIKKSQFKIQIMEKNKINYTLTIIFATIFTALNIVTALFLMTLIDVAMEADMDRLIRTVLISCVYLVVFMIIGIIRSRLLNRYIKKAIFQYKNFIFNRLTNRDAHVNSNVSSGRYLSVLSNDINYIENDYIEGNVKIIEQIVLFVCGLATMIFLNYKLFLCVLVSCLFPIIVSSIFGKSVVVAGKKVSDVNEHFLSSLKDMLSGFFVIKSFSAEEQILKEFKKRNAKLEDAKESKKNADATIFIASNTASFVVLIVTFGIGAWLTIQGEMKVGVVVAFIQLLNFLVGPIKELTGLTSKKKASEVLIEKIENIIEETSTAKEGQVVDSFEDKISFEDVSFSYGNDELTVSNLNYSFIKGKSYAIVGGSGSGKSTIFNLMLGYYQDFTGKILVDGMDIRDIKSESLYNLLSVVQQNVFIFDNSIKENITLFKEFDDDSIKKSIGGAELTNLVSEKGIEYSCGEDGINLSGGEKQRISIARCLLKGTPIILMDEATAALDNSIAYGIEKNILEIEGLTKIIVTHKMDERLLKLYDEIIMVKDGSIAEAGNFETLIQNQGPFYSLYNLLGSAE